MAKQAEKAGHLDGILVFSPSLQMNVQRTGNRTATGNPYSLRGAKEKGQV